MMFNKRKYEVAVDDDEDDKDILEFIQQSKFKHPKVNDVNDNDKNEKLSEQNEDCPTYLFKVKEVKQCQANNSIELSLIKPTSSSSSLASDHDANNSSAIRCCFLFDSW